MRVPIFICLSTTAKSGRKWCYDKWLVNLGVQPWRQRLLMYSRALTFWLCHPPVYLPHLDPLPVWSCGRKRDYVCFCARCICLCMLHIWGWEGTILCSRCKCKHCIRCWLQITELKTGYKKEGKPQKRRKAFSVKIMKYFEENKVAKVW